MHELSICQNIIAIINDHTLDKSYQRVKTVSLEIGQLAGVEISALEFCFDIAAKDSIANHANLRIIEIPGQAWCEPCQQGYTLSQRFQPCSQCGEISLQITQGEELRVKELEVF